MIDALFTTIGLAFFAIMIFTALSALYLIWLFIKMVILSITDYFKAIFHKLAHHKNP